MPEKKFYWLKMKKDFLKRHDCKMIKRRFGFEGLIYYISLLLESIDHNGNLRFSKDVPYDIESLADAIDADYVVFTKLMRVLREKKIILKLKDDTFYLPYANESMGLEGQSAERVRRYRENAQALQSNDDVTNSNDDVTHISDTEINDPALQCNIELEKEKDIEKEEDKKKILKEKFTPPTIEIIKEYCTERSNNVDPEKWFDFYQSKGWMIGKNKMKDWKAAVRTWEKSDNIKISANTKSRSLEKVFDERVIKESDIEDLYYNPFK